MPNNMGAREKIPLAEERTPVVARKRLSFPGVAPIGPDRFIKERGNMSLSRKITVILATLFLMLAPFTPLSAHEEGTTSVPSAKIVSEGVVRAQPDVAHLTFTILTEAPQAPQAAAENAKKAEAFLAAVKKILQEGDVVKTTGYRITPLYTSGDKGKKPVISGYRASNSFQVRIKDLARLGTLLDVGVQQGANEIHGPVWEHSAIDALTQEASVQALQKARQMAVALAASQDLKVKRLVKVTTAARTGPFPRNDGRLLRAAAAPEGAVTPIEVGEEEIRAQIEAVFELE